MERDGGMDNGTSTSGLTKEVSSAGFTMAPSLEAAAPSMTWSTSLVSTALLARMTSPRRVGSFSSDLRVTGGGRARALRVCIRIARVRMSCAACATQKMSKRTLGGIHVSVTDSPTCDERRPFKTGFDRRSKFRNKENTVHLNENYAQIWPTSHSKRKSPKSQLTNPPTQTAPPSQPHSQSLFSP